MLKGRFETLLNNHEIYDMIVYDLLLEERKKETLSRICIMGGDCRCIGSRLPIDDAR